MLCTPNPNIKINNEATGIMKTKHYYFLKIFLFLLLLGTLSFAQKSNHNKPESSGNRHKYNNNYASNSTLSEAADYHNYNQRQNNYDRHRDNYDIRKDSYPREIKNKNDQYTYNKENRRNRNGNDSKNYFHIDKSGSSLWDGKHWDISEFPLKVYVQETSSKYYKSSFKDYVSYAFEVWEKADNRINYAFTNNSRNADIKILFVENLGKKYDENYLGLTEYDTNRNNEIESSKIQISLLKFGSDVVTDGEVKATIIHELGHAFGLGHSDNEKDIMYPYIDPKHSDKLTYNELSRDDKEAVRDVINLGNKEQYVWR